MRASLFTASLVVAALTAGCDKTTDQESASLTAEEARPIALADRHLSGAEGGSASGSQTHSGSLDYVTSEGKEGTCLIDITTEFDATNDSASRTVQGTVCEQTVDVTTTWNRT